MIIVVRTIGERTLPLCLERVKKQCKKYVVVNERPFIRAVEMTFKIGCSYYENEDLLLALDADVVLDHESIKKIQKSWKIHREKYPNLFRLDFMVRDKFRKRVYAGCHLYDNKWSKEFYEFFKKIDYDTKDKRPESSNIMKLVNELKLKSKNDKKLIVGEHDNKQFYRHIFTKYYNRAMRDYKSYDKIYRMIMERCWDSDFLVALKGMEAAKKDREKNGLKMLTDSSSYLEVDNLLKYLNIKEKEELRCDQYPSLM